MDNRLAIFILEINGKVLEKEEVLFSHCYDGEVKGYLLDWAFSKINLKYQDMNRSIGNKRLMLFEIEHKGQIVAFDSIWILRSQPIENELRAWARDMVLLYWQKISV